MQKLSPTTISKPEDKDGINESHAKETSISTADRRAAFQTSKAILSVSGTRRPPLVRAMSAPIRPSSEEARVSTNKRRPIRRRRIGRDRSIDGFNEDALILETADEESELLKDNLETPKGRSNGTRRITARSKSVMGGCDVVTLVSMLSSSGSDSEKEEPLNNVHSY